jgi:hypothetical protein
MPEPRRMYLKEQWNSYLRSVMPEDAPRVQIQECRRAFYAGAQAFIASQAMAIEAAGGEKTAEARALFELATELCEFRRDVLEGRA